MKPFVATCVVLAGFIMTSGQAGAAESRRNLVLEPVQKVKYEYYEVCGCTEKDIQCDLKLKSIKCKDGRKYDSTTNWTLSWDYGRRRDSGTCTTDAFTVTVDIIFKLPKWDRDSKAPAGLADKWDAYVKNIMVHESGHRDRAVSAAADLTRRVADLPPARTCSDLDREVSELAHARVNRLYEEQAEYDRETDHGVSQGVEFP